MAERKPLDKVVVPYHFGEDWSLMLNWDCLKDYRIVHYNSLAERYKGIQAADVVVSGDCMAAVACNHADVLVWYDAHGDFHTVQTTYTGSLGGMPLAMLADLQEPFIPWQSVYCPHTIYHVGGREFDPGEITRMVKRKVRVSNNLPIDEILSHPMAVHLHIDTDVLDFSVCAGSVHPSDKLGYTMKDLLKEINSLAPVLKQVSIKTPKPWVVGSESIVHKLLKEIEHVLQ